MELELLKSAPVPATDEGLKFLRMFGLDIRSFTITIREDGTFVLPNAQIPMRFQPKYWKFVSYKDLPPATYNFIAVPGARKSLYPIAACFVRECSQYEAAEFSKDMFHLAPEEYLNVCLKECLSAERAALDAAIQEVQAPLPEPVLPPLVQIAPGVYVSQELLNVHSVRAVK